MTLYPLTETLAKIVDHLAIDLQTKYLKDEHIDALIRCADSVAEELSVNAVLIACDEPPGLNHRELMLTYQKDYNYAPAVKYHKFWPIFSGLEFLDYKNTISELIIQFKRSQMRSL